MPYISTETVAKKREQLKSEFPDYKLSIRKEHHSTIIVDILEAPIELRRADEMDKSRVNINHFYIDDHYKEYPETHKVLSRMLEIMRSGMGEGYEDGDYGHVPDYYTDINIGQWDKPFKVVERAARPAARPEQRDPAESSSGGARVVYNSRQEGIEIYFPGKPAAHVLERLKSAGFRWSRHNSCWYKRDGNQARTVAQEFGALPDNLPGDGDAFDNFNIDQAADRIGA